MTTQLSLPKAYSLRLFIFTILVIAMFPLGGLFIPREFISPNYPFLGIFFFAVTFLAHRILTQKNLSAHIFINTYMLLVVVRLLLFLSILLVYALLNKTDALAFSIAFLVYYFFFLVFEIVQLLRHKPSAEQG